MSYLDFRVRCGTNYILSPGLDHPLGDPKWGPNLISFSFNVPLEKSFLTFKLRHKIDLFETSYFFIVTDGGWWWMVDGGGWWMVEKKVL